MQSFAGEAHAALIAVQAALTDYCFPASESPANVAYLRVRLTQSWEVRPSSPDHQTAVGALLPDLVRDAQYTARTTKGIERRAARRVLAGVYRLADFSVAYQPAPELVWLVADRAITEAQEADDPYAAERTAPELSASMAMPERCCSPSPPPRPLGYETRCPRSADEPVSSCNTPEYEMYRGRRASRLACPSNQG